MASSPPTISGRTVESSGSVLAVATAVDPRKAAAAVTIAASALRSVLRCPFRQGRREQPDARRAVDVR
ncbi:hypothetical protein [Actinoalloteichus spitiensis]|uniref:hypothetical protein n=1 Tax=Actinoalloteichus spitiensis TaxID=252394 RepID=UPI000379F0E9|nr:hypothetical protein [Actinoalloteichus spitiensis]